MFNDDDSSAINQDPFVNEASIFYHWLEEKVNVLCEWITWNLRKIYYDFQVSKFLATLEHDLPEVTSIDSILGQCTYFGLSFGRVGVDFMGRISDIFIRVVQEKFEMSIRRATKTLSKNMETFTLINKLNQMDLKVEPAPISVGKTQVFNKMFSRNKKDLYF